MAVSTPNTSYLSAPPLTQFASADYALIMYNYAGLAGLRTVRAAPEPGTEFRGKQVGSPDETKYTIGDRITGALVFNPGLLEMYHTLKNHPAGYKSTYFGFPLKTDGQPAAFLVKRQGNVDGTSVVYSYVMWDLVIDNLATLMDDTAGEETSPFEVPFYTTKPAIAIDPLTIAVRESFSMAGAANTVTLQEVPQLITGGPYAGLLPGGDLLFSVRHRLAANTRNYGGADITANITVNTTTRVVTLPVTPAAGDKIDVIYLALIADL
jgi:hypothetical protein